MNDKPAILLTGATGFVGQALKRELENMRCDLTYVSRRRDDSSAQPRGAAHVPATHAYVADLNTTTNWNEHLADRSHIIHCAARVHVLREGAADPLTSFRQVNVDATLHLAKQAAAAGARQFIFISSVKVNGESTLMGRPYTEDDSPAPQDAYGISKYEAEQALLALGDATGMAVTIIRPPLVYGPGVKANFENMLRWVQTGIPLPFASIDNRRSFVYLDNLVNLILTCIDHPRAQQEVFLVSDGEDLSTTQLLRLCAKALDVPSRLLPFPPGLLLLAAQLTGKQATVERLCGNLQVDIGKAKRQLGWNPRWTVQQGLQATAAALAR